MKTNLFIPKTLHVGFQERKDTFTGKLAYVIYEDEKGKKRKETSWDQWCSKDLEKLVLDNKPRAGYVLNKGIHRHSDWGNGRHVLRIWDPRDFEFEITVENLTGILTHSDVSKREIMEEMVFAWAGTELILLPVSSEVYQQSLKFTARQDKKMSARDLVPGCVYKKRKTDEEYTYIGYYEWFEFTTRYHVNSVTGRQDYHKQSRVQKSKGKKHIFWGKPHLHREGEYLPVAPTTLAEQVGSEPLAEYAELVAGFFATTNGQRIVDVRFEEVPAVVFRNQWQESKSYTKTIKGSKSWIMGSVRQHLGRLAQSAERCLEEDVVEFHDKRTFSVNTDGEAVISLDSSRENGYSYSYSIRKQTPYLTISASNPTTTNVYLVLENGKEVLYVL